MVKEYIISEPVTDEEFEQYYSLRFKILREPWYQPRGSERDELEDQSIHVMVTYQDNVVGVARLHFNSPKEAQIRYMAVDEKHRTNGVGTLLLSELERRAMWGSAEYITLNARSNSAEFYEKSGYTTTGAAHVLYGQIPHVKMRKAINPTI